MQEIKITRQTAGGRADKMILKFLDKAPGSFVYKMLRKKNIVINDRKAHGDELLQEGDVIKLYLADETIQKFRSSAEIRSPRNVSCTVNASSKFRNMICFEDENIIAVNKPAGILSQKAAPGDISVNDMLSDYLKGSDMFKPGISNRLDRNTSGLMLAGKNPHAVRLLNAAIKDRKLKKLYLCIVLGKVSENADIKGYIAKDAKSNKVRIYEKVPEVISFEEEPRYIETAYRVVSSGEQVSLLEVDLITGRSHQIRAHLASVGHPIIGDVKYGNTSVNKKYRDKYDIKYQQLHSYKVVFEKMDGMLDYLNGREITCSLPAPFKKIINGEGLCLHGHQED